jgi:hypothetical protein
MEKSVAADYDNLFSLWFESAECSAENVCVLVERDGGRAEVFDVLVEVAVDHVVGLKVIESLGGFPKATHVLKNRVPADKIARSGMLGEILAAAFLEQQTEYAVPVRRLRHRDTRELAMRGDDVLGFHVHGKQIKVMKVEAKSRAKLATATLTEAREGLAKHKGRPNPETLAFLECHLREANRDEEAEPITQLQRQSIRASNVCHMIFTLSGNDPTTLLESNCQPVRKGIELRACGCSVTKHSDFIKAVFDACLAKGDTDGIA